MPRLVDPIEVGRCRAPSRVVFGPHETNLGRGRAIGDRHVAYYAARAQGGTGVIVTETASVHPGDWPYERAPLAAECGPGWAEVARACRPHGTLVLAGLGHAGGQGSSAYSQEPLWAPSPVADAVSREQPMAMEAEELAVVVDGFADAAALAVDSGLAGVEIDAGAFSLLRQFHSGLTNQRSDGYGSDRLLLTTEVLGAVRARLGDGGVLALRLSCDELAPWAGVTPDQAAGQVGALAALVDLLVVVRGGPFSTSAYRPDDHTPATFNRDLCRQMREAAGGRAPVALQGSVIDPIDAQAALDDAACDLVEMTRAQIADPRLVGLVRAGDGARVRPCVLCNQACQVRDNRNPLVTCIGEPRSGYETVDPWPDGTDRHPRDVLVVGAGVAGLECARVLSARGHRVRVSERGPQPGGALAAAAVGRGRARLADLPRWLAGECARQGVEIDTGVEVTAEDLDRAGRNGTAVVLATGGRSAPLALPTDGSAAVVAAADLLASNGSPGAVAGPVVVHDPVGGPVGVGVAEWLAGGGVDVSLVTPDQVAGTLLARTGDLADANVRLQRAGVDRLLRSVLREVAGGQVRVTDVWTGEGRRVACATLVDCGARLPDEELYLARPGTLRAGDCVAPRSALEAVLEGRRRAFEVAAGAGAVGGAAGRPVDGRPPTTAAPLTPVAPETATPLGPVGTAR